MSQITDVRYTFNSLLNIRLIDYNDNRIQLGAGGGRSKIAIPVVSSGREMCKLGLNMPKCEYLQCFRKAAQCLTGEHIRLTGQRSWV